MEVLGTSFSDNSINTANVLTNSHTTSHIPVYDKLNDDFNSNDWIIEANELQALNNLVLLLSTLKLLEEQKYDECSLLMLVTKPRDLISDFYKGDDGRLRRRHPSIYELRQIIVPHSLQSRLRTTAHHHNL